MLEAKAKDQGHRQQVFSRKKGLQNFFSGDLKKKVFKEFFPEKTVSKKLFQVVYKILTFPKIVLSSSRGQGNFRGLEASRPRTWPSRPRTRTSKCVLENSTSALRCRVQNTPTWWKVPKDTFFDETKRIKATTHHESSIAQEGHVLLGATTVRSISVTPINIA